MPKANKTTDKYGREATVIASASVKLSEPKALTATPKTLAECADLLYQTRAERLIAQRVVDDYASLESLLKDRLIEELPKSKASGIAGKMARVTLDSHPIPSVKDWGKLTTYIAKHKAFHLFQRRLNESAVKELWDAKVKLPGVEKFNVITVSCTKK